VALPRPQTPTFAEAVRRASLRYIGPLYVPLILVISWFAFSDESWDATAGVTTLGLLAAIALFMWGTWRWSGFFPWAARVIGFGAMAGATVFAIQFVIIGGPLLLCALPMAWPGVTDADGRHRFWR